MCEGSKIRGIMRKPVLALGLAFGLLAASGTDARAQAQITFTPGADTATFFNQTGLSQQDLTNTLNGLLQMTNAAGFLKRFGDAQSFTSKGMGVDYASEATYVEVGGSASFAFGMDRTYQPGSINSVPIQVQSVGLNASLMAGVSLSSLGIPVMLFGNGMHVPTQQYGDMSGSLDNWGVHAQLRLFGPSRDSSALKMLVRWGGIAVTTGYDYSHMSLRLSRNIPLTNFSIPSPVTDGVNVDVTGSASVSVDMSTKSIPLEVTTSLRLLTLLTAYGGVGFDLQLGGGSNMDVAVDASMVGHATGQNLDLGTAHITLPSHVDPSAARIRGILGAQVNLFILRIFAQLNVANTTPTMASLAVGLRLAY